MAHGLIFLLSVFAGTPSHCPRAGLALPFFIDKKGSKKSSQNKPSTHMAGRWLGVLAGHPTFLLDDPTKHNIDD